jgi:hypothetical protein
LLRAIFVGKAYADGETNARKLLRKNNIKLNKRVAKMAKDLNLPDTQLSIGVIPRIENYLPTTSVNKTKYQIMVIDSNGIFNDPLYLNKNQKFDKYIYLTYENNHFNVITSMKVNIINII